MNLKQYKVKVKNSNYSIDINATDELDALNFIKEEYDLSPVSIHEIPEDSPSEEQIAFANKYGVHIPEGACFDDVNALLERLFPNAGSYSQHFPYQIAEEGLIEYATSKRIRCSKYISQIALYNILFSNLNNKDRLELFAFYVYKFYSNDIESNPNKSIHIDIFKAFANMYEKDDKVIESLIFHFLSVSFFGVVKFKGNSNKYTGINASVLIFKTTYAFLANAGIVPQKRPSIITLEKDTYGILTREKPYYIPDKIPSKNIKISSIYDKNLGIQIKTIIKTEINNEKTFSLASSEIQTGAPCFLFSIRKADKLLTERSPYFKFVVHVCVNRNLSAFYCVHQKSACTLCQGKDVYIQRGNRRRIVLQHRVVIE